VSRRQDSDVIGGRNDLADETTDLPLFAVPVEGAGQRARRTARQKTNRSEGLLRVQEVLSRHPDGLTRLELHRLTGLPIGTVNARVADLKGMVMAHTSGTRITTHEGREVEESVVFLNMKRAG
jgi:hypothetical protein